MTSCGNKKSIPKSIIGKDSITLILEDIQVIESGLTVARNNGMDETPLIEPFYEKLLQKHNQSKERFIRSIEYYCQNPKLLDDSYEKLLPILVEKQSRINR